MESGSIKAIDRTSVHKICSGQVVLTLAVAVKELVENSIDAGATTIEVKLENYGSRLVEVIDNGKGVKACDFQSLTLKHHTSKIADFSDVPFVSTFGFRGEALSSLCALSDLEITTCDADSDVGTALTFDHNGVLIKSAPTPRQAGTTVIIKNIFSTFPVRHKEFLRHLRKEYSKMIQLLTAYCLISVNKRITCCNTSENGKKSVVLSTNYSPSLKDNIISLFGDKQVKHLMEIVQHVPSKEILDEYFLPESSTERSKTFKLEGYVSNSTHGEGRSSTDRQFYFINGRPCDLPKVSKLINEVYHTFNKNQYPFVFLNISLNEGCADVNVTPDKRQIFIPDEKVLLALVKATLIGMYGRQPSQMNASMLSFVSPMEKASSPTKSSEDSEKQELSNNHDSSVKRKFKISFPSSDDEESPLPTLFKSKKLDNSVDEKNDTECLSLQNSATQTLSVTKSALIEVSSTKRSEPCTQIMNPASKVAANVSKFGNKFSQNVNFTLTLPVNEDKMFKSNSPKKSGSSKLREVLNMARFSSKSFKNTSNSSLSMKGPPFKKYDKSANGDQITNFIKKFSASQGINNSERSVQETFVDQGDETETDNEIISNDVEIDNKMYSIDVEVDNESNSSDEIMESSFDEPMQRKRNYKVISFDMKVIKKKYSKESDHKNDSEICGFRKFRSKILPTENQNAEEELKKEISKENFSQMTIIGQFNLGFIITRLGDDLFIVDQHATDEKYNFEQLQKETVLETQLLLQPQSLNLTAVSETILIDNLHVFEMNGFKFKINEENPSGERVQLVSVPVSHNWRFGKEDVDELIFMLTDNPIRMVRPSRVNQMFASRACRKSVMIGTALTIPLMKKLVTHMGEIEQPWNCPHGRPTIRHLFNLNLLKTM
ncbi:Mismatch repair endonuclease PMS2 [Araneus ventricosus]|uniref:Mismatch repair endonuclease PMS2 n=1 Tax=Araneus ventricosus TaxID=182803 RepID=A0A4Y2RHC3_ARAVE|nr:Mismatch repair endonuclease PMS2 [Araneus ventricosus]GBN75192.1 Mismatch repair endonuclease PMS2 [Araneus ventricosus]